MVKSEATRIRLTAQERAALEAAAKQQGSTVSGALRLAIRALYMPDPPCPRNESKEAPKFVQTGGASFGVQS